MGDNRSDFDHGIPMSDETERQQEADLAAVGTAERTVSADAGDAATQSTGNKVEDAKQAIRDNAGKVGQQASDKVRGLAAQGQERAGGALDQLSRMLTDAAGQVDDKLGAQYGQYARQAATSVQGLSDQVRNKDVDELLEDARGFVRKSPAVAIGAAAAIGFVLARLVSAGIDDQRGDRA